MKTIKNSLLVMLSAMLAMGCSKDACPTEVDQFPYRCDKGMDVAFLIDYTGSMGTVINSIKTNITSIVNNIKVQSGGDYRLSLAIFDEFPKNSAGISYTGLPSYLSLPGTQRFIQTTGATTNQYLTVLQPFGYANETTFAANLAPLNTLTFPLGSGVGGPEPGGLLAARYVNTAFGGTWRPFKTKLLIIITDALDGGDDDIANATDNTFLANLATAANTNQIQCMLITSLPTGLSNYETHLINNNTAGKKLMSANFNNISPKIDSMINQLCFDNTIK